MTTKRYLATAMMLAAMFGGLDESPRPVKEAKVERKPDPDKIEKNRAKRERRAARARKGGH